MRIEIHIDGDPEGQLAISIKHDLAGGQDYDYGAVSMDALPDVIACDLEEILAECRALLGLEPVERTQDKASDPMLGALRSLLAELATHHTAWDTHPDVVAAAVRAKQALAAYDHKEGQNAGQ